MRDNLRRYRAIRDACTPWYPGQPSGTVARHLRTLAALLRGIVGRKSTPLPHIAAHVPNGTTPASPRHTLCAVVRPSPPPGGAVLAALCGRLAAPSRLADLGARHGWPRRRTRVHRAADPCRLARARPAAGLAGAPRPEGALSRRSPYRLGRTQQRAAPRGDAGGVAGRWGMRWGAAPADAPAGGLVLRGPPGPAPRGDVAGRALPPGGARRVSPAGQVERVKGGRRHTRGGWSHHGAVWLGQGVARAAVWGPQYGDSRGSLSLG